MSPTSCQTAPPRARSNKTAIIASFSFAGQSVRRTFLTGTSSQNAPVPRGLRVAREDYRTCNCLKNVLPACRPMSSARLYRTLPARRKFHRPHRRRHRYNCDPCAERDCIRPRFAVEARARCLFNALLLRLRAASGTGAPRAPSSHRKWG